MTRPRAVAAARQPMTVRQFITLAGGLSGALLLTLQCGQWVWRQKADPDALAAAVAVCAAHHAHDSVTIAAFLMRDSLWKIQHRAMP